MSTKYKVILIVVSYVGVFALGRYTVPEKIKIETKVVEVEKKVEVKVKDEDKHAHKAVKVVEIDKPDGEKDITTITDEKDDDEDKVDDKTSDDIQKASDTTKTVTKDSGKVTLSALAGVNIQSGQPQIGVSITKQVLGPFTLGVWSLTTPNLSLPNSAVGGSIGITF